MSVTVRDCLSLPSLCTCKVMAGEKGLDNIVSNISAVEFGEFDDAENNGFFVTNDLSVTSLYCARGDVDLQCSIIRNSKESGGAGLVLFYAKDILGGVNRRLIETANQIDYPLIVLPEEDRGLKYSDVLLEVAELILNDRQKGESFVHDSLNRIAHQPETARTLDNLLFIIANRFKCSLFLSDSRQISIAKAFWPAENIADFEKYQSKREQIPSFDFYADSSLSLTLHYVPHGKALDPKELEEIADLISSFTEICNYPLDSRNEGAFLPPLLEGKSERLCELEQASHFHVRSLRNAIFVPLHKKEGLINNPLSDDIIHELTETLEEEKIIHLLGSYGDSLCILFASSTMDEWTSDLRLRLLTILQGGNFSPAFCFSDFSDLGKLPEYFQLYSENAKSCAKIYPHEQVFYYWHLDFARRCNLILRSSESSDREQYLAFIEALDAHPQENLLLTLSTYFLDAGSEIKRAAELLFLHRNTILYRLNKVKTLLGTDPNQMPFQQNLYMAVALNRLLG